VKTLPKNTILTGDARQVLSDLLPESLECCVTSPPYANALRDYGVAEQLGREPSVAEYVENLVAVLRGVRRVLKNSGALWLDLGDSFSKHIRQGTPRGSLLLVPQRVALALAADGWIIRNVVTWSKPSPLPQSAKDRLSPTYEVVIFATKERRYFFDLDAIRIPHRSAGRTRPQERERTRRYQGNNTGLGKLKAAGRVGNARGKNPGDVWTIPTPADRLGHQATFPEALIERPILATCPERICIQCDTAWTRPTRIVSKRTNEGMLHTREVGELQRCDCRAPVRAGVVLDPFIGTGTTALVAERLGRDWLGVELNPAFIKLADGRLRSARRAR
jgi:site-specific DNA-methyltransferase (adenine-specific)